MSRIDFTVCHRIVNHLLARLTPPCRDITRLASESLDRTVPLTTKLTMLFHLLICKGCRRYVTQLRAVRESMRRQSGHGDGTTASPTPRLSDEARAQLKQALKSRRD